MAYIEVDYPESCDRDQARTHGISVGSPIVIGRDKQKYPVQIELPGDYVAERHAKIWEKPRGTLWIKHLSGSNARTFRNRELIATGEDVRLFDEDEIEVLYRDDLATGDSEFFRLKVHAPEAVSSGADSDPDVMLYMDMRFPPLDRSPAAPPVAEAPGREESPVASPCPEPHHAAETPPREDPQKTPPRTSLVDLKPNLVLMTSFHGTLEGAKFPVEGNCVTIGRSEDCSIVLDHPQISRHHAKLERRGPGWCVTDLESNPGVRVGGKRIPPSVPTTIRDGQVLRLGTIKLAFRMGEGVTVREDDGSLSELLGYKRPMQVVLLCLAIAALLAVQMFGCLAHRDARQAFDDRQWHDVQLRVARLPWIYAGILHARALARRAEGEADAKRVAEAISKFPAPSTSKDLQKLAGYLTQIRLRDASAYWDQCRADVAGQLSAYAVRRVKTIRDRLKDLPNGKAGAAASQSLGTVLSIVGDLTHTVRQEWFLANVAAPEVEALKRELGQAERRLKEALRLRRPRRLTRGNRPS